MYPNHIFGAGRAAAVDSVSQFISKDELNHDVELPTTCCYTMDVKGQRFALTEQQMT